MVTVEQVESRADLAECMSFIVDECRQQERRGHVGTAGARYADLHQTLNDLLDHYEWAVE